MNIYNILKLNLRKLALIAVIWIICIILHNVISGLLKFDEPVFFVLAVILIPLYVIISSIYTLFFKGKKGRGK